MGRPPRLHPPTNSPSSGDVLGRVKLTSFAGFATDVGTATSAGGPTGGAAPPVNITRGCEYYPWLIGQCRWFQFRICMLSPGTTSEVLIIETNATAFIPGTVSEIERERRVAWVFRPCQLPGSAMGSQAFWPSAAFCLVPNCSSAARGAVCWDALQHAAV
jgi:hypothetical protein